MTKQRTAIITRLCLLFAALTVFTALKAQQPGARPNMNIGRFYGKVVDEKGKGVGYATVQLLGMRFDTASRAMKETLITGQITADNGDFSLENLPVMGDFTLKVSFIGYAEIEQKVSFGVPMPTGAPGGRPQQGPPAGVNGANMAAMASRFDKDLGNISLVTSAAVLQEVVVTGEAAAAVLALDKKVFRVDKNALATGGTAEDALKNVPSLSVDLDGNVTLRNAAPQIFVDGRPTTLSLNQISADAIESVELITNPSAKYDASGGQGGIVNIVLKKDRRIGYNGNVRAGFDSRGGFNFGGDINAREGKLNGFLNANVNQFRNVGESLTERDNLVGNPPTTFRQDGESKFRGQFANVRGGVDWFVDNRNTLTFSGSFTRGQFKPRDESLIRTDSLFPGGVTSSDLIRSSVNDRNFRNAGASVLFKHLFPKPGREWTADANFNRISNGGGGTFQTSFPDATLLSRERQESDGSATFLTVQSDYVDPINDKMKLEAGVRAAVRRNDNNNNNFVFDPDSGDWIRIPQFADRYSFNDDVYAAYVSFSHQFSRWGYQLGLRAESSQYLGKLPEVDSSFSNNYPLSLFPSAFVTYKINDQDNIQASYTRRVNRPNFWQLMPFTDFSDPLNLRRGNPDLLPEFTNSFEVTYQNIISQQHNLLISLYYKQAYDLITSYQFAEYSDILQRDAVVNSYANSNGSTAYGAEITLKNTFLKNIELTSNLNVYNSRVDASNVETNLINEQFSWFIKENLSVKLPAQFTLQISGEYHSPAAFNPSSGGRFGGGGGPFGGALNTAQGYRLEFWFVDAALRKDLFNRKASMTVSVNDIFRSRRLGSFTESDFFVQSISRLNNPQLVRVNFSYRFGKMDASLFKRKNMNMNTEGMDRMN